MYQLPLSNHEYPHRPFNGQCNYPQALSLGKPCVLVRFHRGFFDRPSLCSISRPTDGDTTDQIIQAQPFFWNLPFLGFYTTQRRNKPVKSNQYSKAAGATKRNSLRDPGDCWAWVKRDSGIMTEHWLLYSAGRFFPHKNCPHIPGLS